MNLFNSSNLTNGNNNINSSIAPIISTNLFDTNQTTSYLTITETIDLTIVSIFCSVAIIGNLLIVLVKLRQSGVISSLARLCFSTPAARASFKLSDLLSILLAVCDITKAGCFFVLEHPQMETTALKCSYLQRGLLFAFSFSSFAALVLMAGRCRAICRPLEENNKKRRKIALIVIFLLHLLVFFGLRKLFLFRNTNGNTLRNCLSADRSRSNNVFLFIEFGMLSLTVVSSVVLMSFYIIRIVRQLAVKQPIKLSSKPERRRQQNICAVKIITSIYIAYMTSFIPWVCLYLISTKNQKLYLRVLTHPASFLISGFISGSFCNSFLTYLRYSSTFRKDLLAIFLCKGTVRSRGRSVTSVNERL